MKKINCSVDFNDVLTVQNQFYRGKNYLEVEIGIQNQDGYSLVLLSKQSAIELIDSINKIVEEME